MRQVTRNLNTIEIVKMDHFSVVSEFLTAIYKGKEAGFSDFYIKCVNEGGIFPDVVVPISGIINFYEKEGITFFLQDAPEYLKLTHLFNPLKPYNDKKELQEYCLDKVWLFENSHEISSIVESYVEVLSQEAIFGSGVLNALSWSLFEIMDNVLQHSELKRGFIMAQIHRQSKKVAFCIFDYGRGIFNSLKGSEYSPRNPLDAITLSIKEGVTRDKSIGQGNGLWGVHQIVKINSGRLVIVSSSASYLLDGDKIITADDLQFLSKNNGCTTVDFQISYDKDISLTKALSGHNPEDMRLLNFPEGPKGELIYNLAEKKFGTGTREAGERVRNDMLNIIKASTKSLIVDFSGIAVISSSFADEVFGKLVIEFGFVDFNKLLKFSNMNDVIGAVINRSVMQRIAQTKSF